MTFFPDILAPATSLDLWDMNLLTLKCFQNTRSTTSNTITAILDWMDRRNVLDSPLKICCKIKIHRRVICKPAMMVVVHTLTSSLVCATFPVFGKVPAKNQGLKTYPNHENQDSSFAYTNADIQLNNETIWLFNIPSYIFIDMSRWQKHY